MRVAFRLGNLHALLTRMPVIKRLPELGLSSEFFVRDETVLFERSSYGHPDASGFVLSPLPVIEKAI